MYPSQCDGHIMAKNEIAIRQTGQLEEEPYADKGAVYVVGTRHVDLKFYFLFIYRH